MLAGFHCSLVLVCVAPCRSLNPYDDAPCHAVSFDHSGHYLGIGGADARIVNAKQVRSV